MKEKLPEYSGIRLKALDILILAFSAAIIFMIGGMAHSGDASSTRVIIRGPEKTWEYPIDAEVELRVEGSIGETVVRISRGRAAIVASPCGGQTCVAAGELHRNGQWAACLPNKVIVLLEGRDGKNGIDASSW